MSSFFDLDFFNRLADEFIAALVHDFKDPVIQKQLIRELTGVINNIQNPMMRMIASEYMDKAIRYAANKASPFLNNVVLSDPPESIDASAKVVKEMMSEKVDSIAERIKKEIQKKKEAKNGNN